MPEIFRCRICGETYYGKHPSHCPYCGAHEAYLVSIASWIDENIGVELSVKSRKNLESTRDLEYENTRFYRAAAAATKSTEIAGYFKYLAKIENEHYNLVIKLLGTKKDNTIFEPSSEMGNDLANLNESKKNEEHASKLYSSFIAESEEQRVKTVFAALSQVEADHIELDQQEIQRVD